MVDIIKDKFRLKLYQKYEICKKVLIPKNEYYKMIEDLKAASAYGGTKSRHDYYLLSKFEVLQCNGGEKLIKKRVNAEEEPTYYITIEDTYDVVKHAHIITGHGGRDRMTAEIHKKFANIPRDVIEIYKSLCPDCIKKHKRQRTANGAAHSRIPPFFKELASRGHFDLVEIEPAEATLPTKLIIVYQDQLTKFVMLHEVASKDAVDVAHQLLDILLLFGAPLILQSNSESAFTAEVVKELKLAWPKLAMVYGKPYFQTENHFESINNEIKDMLKK
uniref:Integrase catalytic domain-containing protein n=1 Tax=Ciona savignyi TaxID=51511 RepID=H2YWF5_CIOSA